MPIADDEDKIPREAMWPLAKRLRATVMREIAAGRPMSARLIHDLDVILDEETTRIRKLGHKFPKMVVVYFEEIGHLEIVRADLEHRGIQAMVQNVLRNHPQCTIAQLVKSVHRAYPSYNPADSGSEAARVLSVLSAAGPQGKWR